MSESRYVEPDIEIYLNLLTTRQLTRMFNRSMVTIHHWRAERGLPYIILPTDTGQNVRFEAERVVEWAAANGKEIVDPNVVHEHYERFKELLDED